MTSIKYRLIEDDEFSGAVIFLGGQPRNIESTHPNFDEIRELLLTQNNFSEPLTEDDLLALVDPVVDVTNRLTALSERFSLAGTTIYLDGDELDTALTRHIIRLVEAENDDKDKGYPAFVNFAEKLYTNPSKKSIKHLFKFMEKHNITIHPDGDVILYKGVREDGTSVHAGYGIVNGEIFEYAHLPNEVGSVVEIPRSMVDEDRGVACSTGLHAGNFRYANSFAPRLVTVKVNPRDVVSVPNDSNDEKLRISRYVVVGIAEAEIASPTLDVPAEENVDEVPVTIVDGEVFLGEPGVNFRDPDADEPHEEDVDGLLDDEEEDAGPYTITVTVTKNGRDSKGRFVRGDANPGKTQPRDEKGHFLPTH